MSRKLELLLGAALAAIAVPAAAQGGPHGGGFGHGTAPQADPGDSFRAPRDPVILTRELRKTLSDGQQFVTRRRYAIHFVPTGDGYLVEGNPVGSEVEAPAELAALAEIERTRPDTGPFPLRLDRKGMIIAARAADNTRADRRVITAAASYLGGNASLSDSDRAAALAVASRLHAQALAAGTNWPADLFRPARQQVTDTRELPLPGGGGRVTISITASDSPSGLMERFQRRVVTELGGSSRLSVETWTLASAR